LKVPIIKCLPFMNKKASFYSAGFFMSQLGLGCY
jgi:hypothetical protein